MDEKANVPLENARAPKPRPAFIVPSKSVVQPILVKQDPFAELRKGAQAKLLILGKVSDYQKQFEADREEKRMARAARKAAQGPKKSKEQRKAEKKAEQAKAFANARGIRDDGVAAEKGSFIPTIPVFTEAHRMSDVDVLKTTNGASIHDKGMRAIFYANGGEEYRKIHDTDALAWGSWRAEILKRVSGVKVAPGDAKPKLPENARRITPSQTFSEAQRIRLDALPRHVELLDNEHWLTTPIRKGR